VAVEIPKSLSILREACARNGVAFEIVDGFSGFVARLTKGPNSHLVGAAGVGVFPINRAAPFAIARDKAFTHDVLRAAGFAVPEGEHFFLRPPNLYVRPPGRERADAIRYAMRLSDGFSRPLIVKPNAGKGAKLVTFIRDQRALEETLDAIATIDEIALIQTFIDAPEYRLFLIDGEIAFVYGKSRPAMVGDGRATVQALCLALEREGPTRFAGLSKSAYLLAELARRGLDLNSVLAEQVRLPVSFISNISASGQFTGFFEPGTDLRHWAKKLAAAVSLRVTGIDAFSRSKLRDIDDIVVTDVNGSPNLGTLFDLGHRELVFDVWETVLRKTFDEPWPEGF
jgi:glutathione synthase/RimK-type ligase-like ATP-grasp enzyme